MPAHRDHGGGLFALRRVGSEAEIVAASSRRPFRTTQSLQCVSDAVGGDDLSDHCVWPAVVLAGEASVVLMGGVELKIPVVCDCNILFCFMSAVSAVPREVSPGFFVLKQ